MDEQRRDDPASNAPAGSSHSTKLMLEFVAGRREALEELQRLHWDQGVMIAWQIVRREPAAEEVVQRVFKNIFALGGRSFTPEKGLFEGWFATCVKNEALKILEAEKRRTCVMDRYKERVRARLRGEDELPSPEVELDATLVREEVREAVARLPRKERLAIETRYLEEGSIVDVQERLRVRPSAAYARLGNGLAMLKVSLAPVAGFFDAEQTKLASAATYFQHDERTRQLVPVSPITQTVSYFEPDRGRLVAGGLALPEEMPGESYYRYDRARTG